MPRYMRKPRSTRQAEFCSDIVNMFKSFMPSGKVEIRDYINDGNRSGEHTATQYSSEHVIKISSALFDMEKNALEETVDTIVHEAHHAAMHDMICMLLAGSRLTKDEIELIVERSAWFCGFAAKQILVNADSIRKNFEFTK